MLAVDVVLGLDSLALVFGIGLLATLGLLIPLAGFTPQDRRDIMRTALRLCGLCIGVLWLTSLAWLWTRTAAMTGQAPLAALDAVPKVLFRSHFGVAWWLRATAIIWLTLAAGGAFYRGAITGPAFAALLFGLALVAASRSAAGHAAAGGDGTLREAMDWLHLISVSIWGGSLIAVLLLVFPRWHRTEPSGQAEFGSGFSRLAAWALFAVLVTGIYNAWQMLPQASTFWTSHYGRLLALKLLFVAGMVACGAVNRYRLVPRLQPGNAADAGMRGLRKSVTLEVLFLLLVLAVTAVLLGSAPPVA